MKTLRDLEDCETCNRILTRAERKIENLISNIDEPCFCGLARFIEEKNKEIKRLKKELESKN